GVGGSEGEQQRIFERFYRADQARSRRTGGSGLGLAIVKHAVQRHGGEVRMWSRPGRGSTFMIRLARVDAGDAGHGRRKAGKSKSPKSPKPSKSPKAGKTAEAAKGERP